MAYTHLYITIIVILGCPFSPPRSLLFDHHLSYLFYRISCVFNFIAYTEIYLCIVQNAREYSLYIKSKHLCDLIMSPFYDDC